MAKRKHRSNKHAGATAAHAKMVRRNVTFTDRHATLLDRERERSGVPTATLLRQLIESYFKSNHQRKEF